jgi:alpha-ribazole phosphatase
MRDRLAMEKLDVIFSSTLKRARTTALTIASLHNLPVIPCPDLREIDFGEIEGLSFDEVKIRFPEVALSWINHDPGLMYPGGESLTHVEERVSRFIDVLGRDYATAENIAVVAHSGVLRTLICQLLGMEMKHRWNMRVDLASLTIVETYSGFAVLSVLNDTSHLVDKCE